MSNQIDNKWHTLHEMLAANGLTKIAGDQTIKHLTPESQKGIGKTDQKTIEEEVAGTVASSPEATVPDKGLTVDTPPLCQDLNESPKAALSATGTKVHTMDQAGNATKCANMNKDAAFYRRQLASILHAKNAQEKTASEFRSASEVMAKIASLTQNSTEAEFADCQNELLKLASTNPVFSVVRDNILMQKLAEDIEALADAEGISPEDAADWLDAAAEANPEMMAEAEDQANGEAVAELADAEQGAADLADGCEELAATATQNLGVEVAPEDIMDAIDDVQAQAEELGVEPEDLIQAALEEMQGGEDDEPTPEEEAAAQEIMDAGAAEGLSPEEIIEAALSMDGEDGAEEVKEASYRQPVRQAATPRAAFVQSLINR